MAANRIAILYEDEDLLVVNKPPLMLTLPDRYAPEKFNLLHYLSTRYGKVFVVHRLDKETSGVLCFARNPDAHRHLSLQFERRQVRKIYHTVVEGELPEPEGTINKPIAEHSGGRARMIISAKGKPSVTTYRVLEQFRNFALVEAQIETGRTHQIRVHFQSQGFPLAVDALYGRRAAIYAREIKTRNFNPSGREKQRPLMERSALHAFRLELQHPRTEQPMKFEAPWPKDFKALVQQLRKWR